MFLSDEEALEELRRLIQAHADPKTRLFLHPRTREPMMFWTRGPDRWETPLMRCLDTRAPEVGIPVPKQHFLISSAEGFDERIIASEEEAHIVLESLRKTKKATQKAWFKSMKRQLKNRHRARHAIQHAAQDTTQDINQDINQDEREG